MELEKTGKLILALRKEKGLTQLALSKMMNISDKTVSKWERGQGLPDVSLLPKLSEIFEINLSELLSGEMTENDENNGNIKNAKFYVCGKCGSVNLRMGESTIFCCGKKLEPAAAQKASEEEKLKVERVENDLFVSSEHEMTKEHYISFVAFITGDTALFRKTYPEWNLETRIPFFKHGTLYHYCTKHGLFYQYI